MKTAYKNGILLDGSIDMEPTKGKCILVEDEMIVGVLDESVLMSGMGEYDIVDLQGAYIMPGLINLHVHLPASGKPKKKPTDPVKLVKLMTRNNFMRKIMQKMCEGFVKTELLSGVTTLRSVGGVEDIDTKIRDRINCSEIVGPRILAGNMAISVEGGHMAGSLAYMANNEKEAIDYVQKIAKEHPDLIKLMITGGVLDAKVKGEPGVLKMKPEIVKAACDEAHRLGMVVAAHVESSEGVEVALANGVDTIEHGAKPSKRILDLFKERQAVHIATLSPALPYALFDRSISNVSEMEQYNGNVVFEGIIECAKACLENDIPVGLGTDTGCPYITHYDMWRELNYFHKYCGVSNRFALYTATARNAKIAKIDHLTGTIEKGKCADMIVCKKNPLEDLSVLRNLEMVIAKGHRIDQPKVKKMPEVEKELDKFL